MKSEFWNQRYSAPEYVYGIRPNEFFRSNLEKFPAGKILLPGEGEGRNAVFAASMGWSVDAFDQSVEAKRKADRLANEKEVKIFFQLADIESFTPKKTYDLIGLFFLHFPPSVRFAYHTKMGKWLKPGGSILLEAFTPDQLKYGTGGPSDQTMLYNFQILKADFSSFQINHLEEGETHLEEGTGHSGLASTIRMIAQKPLNQLYEPQ
jgi:SAM-dependent methyltransferase